MRYQNTACDGDNDEAGTCLYENECTARKGTPIGRCANGFAACCSFKFTCGAETSQNETLFVNRQFPRQENETNTCQVTIKKTPDICQLRLGKDSFYLLSFLILSFFSKQILKIFHLLNPTKMASVERILSWSEPRLVNVSRLSVAKTLVNTVSSILIALQTKFLIYFLIYYFSLRRHGSEQ